MRTLTEKYNGTLSGKYNKAQFLRDVKLAHPELVNQFNGYDDAVQILRRRGMIWEVKQERWEDIQASLNTQDRAVDTELEEKGFDTSQANPQPFAQEDLDKAIATAMKKLKKDPAHYYKKMAGDKSKKVEMVPATKSNAVDKLNAMEKAQLKEAVKKIIVRTLTEGQKKKLVENKLDAYLNYDQGDEEQAAQIRQASTELNNVLIETEKFLNRQRPKMEKALDMAGAQAASALQKAFRADLSDIFDGTQSVRLPKTRHMTPTEVEKAEADEKKFSS